MTIDVIDIPGFEGIYAVNSNGSIWSYQRKSKTGRPSKGQWLKPRLAGRKYLTVSLRSPGERYAKSYFIHRLVLMAFEGKPNNPKVQCNHIDGNKLNNKLDNLEWTTSSGNRKHAWENGLIKQTEGRREAGIKRGLKLRKLSDEQVSDLRYYHSLGVSKTTLADGYGVDRKSIYNILNNKTYLRQGGEQCSNL